MTMTSDPRVVPEPLEAAGEPETVGVGLATTWAAPAGAEAMSAPSARRTATMVSSALPVAEAAQCYGKSMTFPALRAVAHQRRLVTGPRPASAWPAPSLVSDAATVKDQKQSSKYRRLVVSAARRSDRACRNKMLRLCIAFHLQW